MNEPELPTSVSTSELANQIATLQRQVFMLLVVLLVVSLTLAAYLWYQDHSFRRELQNDRPQVSLMVGNWKAETTAIPQMTVSNFVTQIVVYGQRNPDFAQQVLRKYGLEGTPAPAPKR